MVENQWHKAALETWETALKSEAFDNPGDIPNTRYCAATVTGADYANSIKNT